jgi:hypothetical protein
MLWVGLLQRHISQHPSQVSTHIALYSLSTNPSVMLQHSPQVDARILGGALLVSYVQCVPSACSLPACIP